MKSTEIVFVLDRSGSMSSIAADMRGGFDAFVEEQRKLPGVCRVTLTQFDTDYEIVYSGTPIDEVPPLKLVPRGWTALYDAVGRTIDEVGARLASTEVHKRPDRVLFVIVTDGGENASTEYSAKRVKNMVTHQRDKYSWDFIFLGANQDVVLAAHQIGIAAGATMHYDANRVGSQAMYGSLSTHTSDYRGGKDIGNIQATYTDTVSKT